MTVRIDWFGTPLLLSVQVMLACHSGVSVRTPERVIQPKAPVQAESQSDLAITLSVDPSRGYDAEGWPKLYASIAVAVGAKHVYWFDRAVDWKTIELRLVDQDNHVIPYGCLDRHVVPENEDYMYMGAEGVLTQPLPLSCYDTSNTHRLTITATYRVIDCNRDNPVPIPDGFTRFCGPVVSNTMTIERKMMIESGHH